MQGAAIKRRAVLLFTGLLLASCASGPDWVPTTMTPAERAKMECRNSKAVSEAKLAEALNRRLFTDFEEDAMDACMALKGFKRS